MASHADTVVGYTCQDIAQHMVRCAWECNKIGHFHRVYQSRKSRVINEMGQEDTQENTEDYLETVSINSVCFNKNHSVLTAKIKLIQQYEKSTPKSIDNDNIIILYKRYRE